MRRDCVSARPFHDRWVELERQGMTLTELGTLVGMRKRPDQGIARALGVHGSCSRKGSRYRYHANPDKGIKITLALQLCGVMGLDPREIGL